MDQVFHLQSQPVGREHEKGFEADVAGIAHAHGHAEHRDVEHQQQCEAFSPGGGVVEHIAAEHLPAHGADHCDETEDAQPHAGTGEGAAKFGVHEGSSFFLPPLPGEGRGGAGGVSTPAPSCPHPNLPPEGEGANSTIRLAYLVSCTRLTRSLSFASVMNLSYTGFIAAWNGALSTSMISAPPAFTVASDLISRSSHCLRM